MYRVAIDVGGTFTDLSLYRESDGAVFDHKTASTPQDPSIAIARGLRELLGAHDAPGDEVAHFAHGTTVATNMLIERRGAATGLLTTAGFRDVAEIGRQIRPALYDYSQSKPTPIARRRDRVEVKGRIDVDGSELVPLSKDDVERACRAFNALGIESVAICFLHAYRNANHEEQARAWVAQWMPNAFVSVSSAVNPEFREFERTATTLANAYVGPRMSRYLARLQERVTELGLGCEPYTFQSNGGLMSVAVARRLPVRTCLSGPAGGVVGAAAMARSIGLAGAVTFDVGGTSTDVSLIVDGRPSVTAARSVGGVPIRTPMVDVHVLGAGGGSIAYVDDAGALKVGPQSAGAEPGPAAYGQGAEVATLTDAAICVAQLNPTALLDGRMPMDAPAAREAVHREVAEPLGISVEAAALGVLDVAIANIARAIRTVSVERGFEPASLALVAFGGAGPLLAARLAREVGCERVIIPPSPGTSCARGILQADIRFDLVASVLAPATASGWPNAVRSFETLLRDARAQIVEDGLAFATEHCVCSVDARYRGQSFELSVPVVDVGPNGLDAFCDAFQSVHRQHHGYDIDGRDIDIVNCRLAVQIPAGDRQTAGTPRLTSATSATASTRLVCFDAEEGYVSADIVKRDALAAGTEIMGPAIIEEMSTTTVVPPGASVRVDAEARLVMVSASRIDGESLAT